jgi:uncharacterized protein YjbI with pentapeptide repeats
LEILKQGVETWNQWRKEQSFYVQPDFSGADLRGAILVGADLIGATLGGADLSEADLRGATLCYVNLSEATFGGSDLTNADLSEADLSNAHFSRANLSGTDLSEADLRGADLTSADLSNAHLRAATLSEANLGGADLTSADLRDADLISATLIEATLDGADLSGAALNETNFAGATLTRCSIYNISAWNVNLEGATQDSLRITPYDEPIITVDNLMVAQFIYLLLNNQELRDVFNTVTQRGILLLGRFSDGGLEILEAMKAELRKMKYLPMLFDFDRPDNRDYTETFKTLAGLSRFVIVDLSGPSVPQELYATVPHFDIPFVFIIQTRWKAHSMFRDLLKYPWVLPPVTFTDKKQLMELLPSRIIEPAEQKCQKRQTVLNQLFHR